MSTGNASDVRIFNVKHDKVLSQRADYPFSADRLLAINLPFTSVHSRYLSGNRQIVPICSTVCLQACIGCDNASKEETGGFLWRATSFARLDTFVSNFLYHKKYKRHCSEQISAEV